MDRSTGAITVIPTHYVVSETKAWYPNQNIEKTINSYEEVNENTAVQLPVGESLLSHSIVRYVFN